jgi:hypothetical protein
MVRFSMNRWLGFVLALCLLTTSFFLLLSVSAPATASAESGSVLAPKEPTSSGGPTFGDPDVPLGPGDGKSGMGRRPQGRVELARTVQGIRHVGDVTVTGSVVMDRVRLVLLSLRSLYLGF